MDPLSENTEEKRFGTLVNQLKSNIHELNGLVRSIRGLTERLGTSRDSHDVRKKLEELRGKSRTVGSRCNDRMRDLNGLVLDSNKDEHRIVRARLKKEVQELTRQIQSATNDSVSKERATPLKVHISKNDSSSRYSSLLDDDNYNDEYENENAYAQREEDVSEDEHEGLLAREKASELRGIASNVQDVRDMFVDLAALVNNQGEQVDYIEQNISTSVQHAEEGRRELVRASRQQNRARMKKLCLWLIVATVAIVVLYLIFKN